MATLDRTYHPDCEGARKALPEYFSILSGGRKARFRSCGIIGEKAAMADRMLSSCRLCEHACSIDRLKGRRGFCGVLEPRVYSEFIHLGEEEELVPSYTVFFAGCNFRCAYCQNADISQRPDSGVELAPQMLARLIERQHARNVNWVGGEPTPNLPFILKVLSVLEKNIPQVWNSNMYLTKETMNLLDGVIDVYLTDFKYGSDECAKRLSGIDNYLEIVKRNHLLAGKQCEMIVRHLMLPGHYDCCTKPVLDWIRENLDGVRVNLMDQYRPAYQSFRFAGMNHGLPKEEYEKGRDYARKLGLNLVD
jgi:putative pyruvate formate lyase activating enzyme